MAQKLFEDKIGALSHNAGIISLAPSKLTIGGQQYVTTSVLQLVLPALTANALYMLYATVSGGVVSLVQSTNFNSIGPGTTSWKLVGAYMASDVAVWGAFVNIEGTPRTQSALTYLPSSTGFGTLSGQACTFARDGKYLLGDLRWATGTVVGSVARIGLPVNLSADTAYLASTTHILGPVLNNSSVQITNAVIITSDSLTNILFNDFNSLSASGRLGNTSPFASGQIQSCQVRIPISGWDNKSLKDL